jgi:protein-tyrosine phosphatase
MPKYVLEKLFLADNWERETYSLFEELYEKKEQEQEGLIYLFREWLDLVSPADFGTDEGLEGVLV